MQYALHLPGQTGKRARGEGNRVGWRKSFGLVTFQLYSSDR